MSRPLFTARFPLWQLPGAALLVLALLWAQLLGLAHGVLHVHGLHDVAASAQAHQPGPERAHAHGHDHAGEGHGPHGLLGHLLAPAADEDGCRLYDPLAQDAPAGVQPLALPTALPLLPAWVVLQALQPRPCVAFAARAPPVTR